MTAIVKVARTVTSLTRKSLLSYESYYKTAYHQPASSNTRCKTSFTEGNSPRIHLVQLL